MQFTRKGDYALRAMAYLANSESQNPHTINEISEKSGVPRHFLAKILKDLTEAGLLIAIKGARGGYSLAKNPAEINLLDIMEGTLGPMALNICLEGENRCPDLKGCGFYPIWQRASEAMLNVFRETNLQSLHH